MKDSFLLYASVFILFLNTASCQQNKKQKPDAINSNESVVSRPNLDHYWDQYDFTDTLAMKNPDIGEQAFVDFIGLLSKSPSEQIPVHIHNMLSKAEADSMIFNHFVALGKKYLYHPNSPMYNESYYEAVLDFLTNSKWSDATEKLRAEKELNLLRKNKPGEPAEDFSFRLTDGQTRKMSEMQLHHLVLFFYEPGCSSCEESIAQLANSPGFTTLLGKGEVEVLAVYTSGDQKIWKDYQPSIPADWANAFDENMSILKNDLYDLKASPTIYLLDKDRKVILKDTNVATLFRYFSVNQ